VSPRVVAIVLAAGRGERMGGPKALLAWPLARPPFRHDAALGGGARPLPHELPLAAAHAVARLGAESGEVLVVVRAPLVERLAPWLPPNARLLASHAPDEQGQAGSLACAATSLSVARPGSPPPDLVLVTPVDCPPASAAVVEALVRVLATDRSLSAARPLHAARRGHPVVLRAALLARYLAPEPPTLRALLASLGAAVSDVPVDDPNVLVDLNSAEQLGAVGLGAPRFVT
jgi:CTP:molybdopterin cytidylyltransferase MocA